MLGDAVDDVPANLRALVTSALEGRANRELAIEALRRALQGPEQRTPGALLVLAMLTYQDARDLVLHRLRAASEEAVALVDEAIRLQGGATAGMRAAREAFMATLEQERAREDRLLGLAHDPGVRPAQLAALAHHFLMRGDDDLARALFEAADRLEAEEPLPPSVASWLRSLRLRRS